MEIGKLEKFDIKKIAVNLPTSSPLRTRIEGLNVGDGFVVEGVERTTVGHITQKLNREGRRIVCHKLGVGKYQVVRVK